MKNKFVFLVSSVVLLFSILACSKYNPMAGGSSENSTNNSKTLPEKAIDSTVGEEKIGIPECDELMDYISEQSKNQDDGYVTKATREFFLNQIRESIKQSIEENKNDPKTLAKNCKDYKKQLDKFKAEEDSKK